MVPERNNTPITDESEAAAEARRLIEDAYRPIPTVPTSYRDDTPLPLVGTAPPHPQPGRPPMSQRAADASGMMLAAGYTSVLLGGSASLVLWVAGHVDPLVVALIAGTPVAFLGVLARVFKSAKAVVAAVPPEQTHLYTGTVIQDHRQITATSTTRGLVARTHNDLHN
ncbi:hypothetical protein ACFWBC_10470 [Streptomyces sp. NPDC059985]|uniref:hypothetical protein n=1 Tax=Streptomyces sp. NPDC059985 TaxID=3347025 RepID=UPI0036CB20D0